jgi:hypothetical protein
MDRAFCPTRGGTGERGGGVSSNEQDQLRFRCFISKTEDPLLFHIFGSLPSELRQKMLKRVLRKTPVEAFGMGINDIPPELRDAISNWAIKATHQERMQAKKTEVKALDVKTANLPPDSGAASEGPANDEPPEFLKNGLGVFGGDYEGFTS